LATLRAWTGRTSGSRWPWSENRPGRPWPPTATGSRWSCRSARASLH